MKYWLKTEKFTFNAEINMLKNGSVPFTYLIGGPLSDRQNLVTFYRLILLNFKQYVSDTFISAHFSWSA